MFQRKPSEDLVPISVIERLIDMHYKHLEQVTQVYMDKLAEVVTNISTPVYPVAQPGEKMWLSEDEEDEQYLSMKGELAAIADRAKEMGMDLGELSIER